MARRFIAYCVSSFAFTAVPVLADTVFSLPPVEYADTETSTNMPFAVGAEGAGRFTLSLECLATPSNNVEAAFGCDADHDGILDLGEIAFTVGWDCGAWFVRQGCDGFRIEEQPVSTNAVKMVSLNLRFGASGQPRRLEAVADGQPLFPALATTPPEWLNVRRCDLIRLTGRGLDSHGESFDVRTTSDAIAVRFR